MTMSTPVKVVAEAILGYDDSEFKTPAVAAVQALCDPRVIDHAVEALIDDVYDRGYDSPFGGCIPGTDPAALAEVLQIAFKSLLTTAEQRRIRYAPADWEPDRTRVRYIGRRDRWWGSKTGTYACNNESPEKARHTWRGVLIQFDEETELVEMDPADLEVIA